MIRFLQDLIRIPSVNGEHDERPMCERILQEARDLNMHAEIYHAEGFSHRPNVVVSVGEGEPVFLFVAHVDTVSFGDETKWKYPPLSATIDSSDGRMYGRGACDNKGGIACSLYAMAELAKTLPKNFGKILFAGVADEESGADSDIGLRYLLKNNLVGRPRGAIYTELNRVVTIGHRGLIRLVVEVQGESVHTGSSAWTKKERGAHAVLALAEIMLRIEQYPWPEDRDEENFAYHRLVVTPGTIFNGGSYESVVPDHAKGMIDVRLMPSSNPQFVIDKINEIVQGTINKRNNVSNPQNKSKLTGRVTVKAQLPAALIPGGIRHPLAKACVDAVKQVIGEQQQIEVRGCGPSNEGYMLMNAGIPTICGFGPLGGNPHGLDEWVDMQSLRDTVEIYSRVVQIYCGVSL